MSRRHLIAALKYIADSPPRQHGGFHPQTKATAAAALALIRTLSGHQHRHRKLDFYCALIAACAATGGWS